MKLNDKVDFNSLGVIPREQKIALLSLAIGGGLGVVAATYFDLSFWWWLGIGIVGTASTFHAGLQMEAYQAVIKNAPPPP